MDTKSMIIDKATKLFQQKGYKGTGLSEIIQVCEISKGALYHHFPHGKEELLIVCLRSLKEDITKDTERIFSLHSTTLGAVQAMIGKLIGNLETDGTITGHTFSSIISEMGSLSDPVRNACAELYQGIQDIYFHKLLLDGMQEERAQSVALMLSACIEGAMMLCQSQDSTDPLKGISAMLPTILKEC